MEALPTSPCGISNRARHSLSTPRSPSLGLVAWGTSPPGPPPSRAGSHTQGTTHGFPKAQ